MVTFCNATEDKEVKQIQKKDWRLTWDELQFIWVSSFPPQLLSICISY